MIKKTTLLAVGMTALFFGLAMAPVTAQADIRAELSEQESHAVTRLMDKIEQAAMDATSYREFIDFLRSLLKTETREYRVLEFIITRLLDWILAERSLNIFGNNLSDLLENRGTILNSLLENRLFDRSKKFFVISFGSYKRYSPFKDNEIKLFKEGLSFWRYSGNTMFSKGRTLILERQPFGIRQRVSGKQLGVMFGFRGLYLDIESKLTGNTYHFFMGRAQRIRSFDLTPFK